MGKKAIMIFIIVVIALSVVFFMYYQNNQVEIIKKEFGLAEKEVLEIMKKKMPAEKFEMWKKKAAANKPKPKPVKIDDFDDELDGKYYIKNKFD